RREVVPRPRLIVGQFDAVLVEEVLVGDERVGRDAVREGVLRAVDLAGGEGGLFDVGRVDVQLAHIGERAAVGVGGEVELVHLHDVRHVAGGGAGGETIPVAG